jgi:hypothetical protein
MNKPLFHLKCLFLNIFKMSLSYFKGGSKPSDSLKPFGKTRSKFYFYNIIKMSKIIHILQKEHTKITFKRPIMIIIRHIINFSDYLNA